MCQWKNFENRSVTDDDMVRSKVPCFLWPTVYISGLSSGPPSLSIVITASVFSRKFHRRCRSVNLNSWLLFFVREIFLNVLHVTMKVVLALVCIVEWHHIRFKLIRVWDKYNFYWCISFKKFCSVIYGGLSSCKLCLILLVRIVCSRLVQILAGLLNIYNRKWDIYGRTC